MIPSPAGGNSVLTWHQYDHLFCHRIPGAHPYKILGVAVTVVPIKQCESAFCHLRVGMVFNMSFANRACCFHTNRTYVT